MARALINVPAKAKRGDVIEIKTLISHLMETGFRHTTTGVPIPRDIITSFVCTYNGEEIFRAELSPAIAANPFIMFSTVATESGTLEFKWTGDNGFSATESAPRSPSNEAGMTEACAFARSGCLLLGRRAIAAQSSPPRSRSPSAAPATTSWAATPRRCRTTTPPIPACCGCSTARRCGSAKDGAAGKVVRRLPRRRARKHEGRRRALSSFDAALRSPGRSRAADQHLPQRAAARRRPSPTRARSCSRSRPMSRASRAAMPIASRPTSGCSLSSTPAAPFQPPPGPAQPLLRPVPRRQLGPVARRHSSRRRIRPATRSIGSNGRAVGSLQRRLRNCMFGMRAEPYAYGSPEYVALELT